MPAMSCNGANTTGHSAFPPTTVTSTQSKTFIAGCAALVDGDPIVPHTRIVKPYDTHGGTVKSTTEKVYVGGKKAVMIGDTVTCGDTVAKGSNKTFCN